MGIPTPTLILTLTSIPFSTLTPILILFEDEDGWRGVHHAAKEGHPKVT